MKKEKKAIVIIMDGWGIRQEKEGNAIAQAVAPTYHRLLAHYPNGLLEASGLCVGLPDGVMGNSEVGHMNIGGGRRVLQEQVRIHASIDDGTFFSNPVLKDALEKVRQGSRKLHLLGLVSQGDVHSAQRHYFSLLSMAHREKIPAERVFVHAFLDGRDTPPKSAAGYLRNLEEVLLEKGGRIASVSGRFYAMDRDKRWERTGLAYEALVLGQGQKAKGALGALQAAYDRGETDEFVQPTILVNGHERPLGTISSGDVVICFNFRSDRMRQLVQALTGKEAPISSRRSDFSVLCYTFTEYDKTFGLPVVFGRQHLGSCLGEIISANGFSQFRTAETEKYAHVTYFFNGGIEKPFPNEERLLIPSPKVRTYDLQPEMSSVAVTQAVVNRVRTNADKLIVVNFAQPDMVGHTGVFDASILAVEATDRALREIVEMGLDHGFGIFLTADHGNIEMMKDPSTGQPHTAHTTNPVPFIGIGEGMGRVHIRSRGVLGDIAPTVLSFLGIEKPVLMSGESLLQP